MSNKLTLVLPCALICESLIASDGLSSWVGPASSLNAGDTAWVMLSAILVLFMTIPGLALFYAGMVRKKNILSTMVQSFAVCCVVCVIWIVCGYSLAFTPSNAFIGGLDRLFLSGLGVFSQNDTLTIYPGAGTIPEAVFMLFQMAFAIIAGAIITGAFAERIKFSASLIFVGIWTLIVYVPTAHWVWADGGWLAEDGVLDYAGGTVIHINSGIAGLVAALFVGKRLGYGKDAMAPFNLTLTLIGCALLWVGWFGFNAGSALEANARAALALVTTQISASIGALVWLICEIASKQKPSALGLASGAVAGLVGVTPAAGFIEPQSAVFIGAITSVVCYFTVTKLKYRLGYDDSLDAFGIHGVGGIAGAVLTGIFASSIVTGDIVDDIVWVQVKSVLITVVYSGVVSAVILWVMSRFTSLRVEADEERQGLDLVCHGERIE